MDVTIQNQRLPALEVNGRYYQTFTPLSAGELIKLHHMGCVGDTVITDIQLEQGDFPTSFVEPTVTQRSLSGLFNDMRNIELELRDPASTFWGKIQQTNEGALTQFFKDKVKSAIAQTASEIRTEVADAVNKARVQVTADGVIIGSTKITGEQLASTISVSPKAIELIAPKIKVKSDMIVDGAITAGKLSAGAIRSEHIQANAITSKQLMVDLAMAEKLASSEILAKKLFAKEAFGQLHDWNPTSKEGKAAKAIAHGVVAEVSARMAENKPGSVFYAGATNESLVGEIQKIAKEKPDVAQSLSALLGAAVNSSLGYSPVTGAAEAQYGTKWNQLSEHQIESLRIAILRNLDDNGSVEALIRILENGATLGYAQEAGNPSLRKNADGSYAVRAEGKLYADDMFLGVKGLGTRIANKIGINYHVTLTNKDVSLEALMLVLRVLLLLVLLERHLAIALKMKLDLI